MRMDEPMGSYGRYEGSQQQYEAPYNQAQSSTTYDDNFIEALAQRIAQRMQQGSLGRLSPSGSNVPPGMRLGLAIVSVCVLIPLAGIMIAGTSASAAGFLSFGVACAAIAVVNIVFNAMSRR